MTQVLHDLCQGNFKREVLPFKFPEVYTTQGKVSVSVVTCVSSHWVANHNYDEEGYINRAEEGLEFQVNNNYNFFFSVFMCRALHSTFFFHTLT